MCIEKDKLMQNGHLILNLVRHDRVLSGRREPTTASTGIFQRSPSVTIVFEPSLSVI
jgi:hypothetical protein